MVTTAINSSWRISRLRTANTLDLCGEVWMGGEGKERGRERERGGKRPGCFSGGLISLVVVVVLVVFFFLPPFL